MLTKTRNSLYHRNLKNLCKVLRMSQLVKPVIRCLWSKHDIGMKTIFMDSLTKLVGRVWVNIIRSMASTDLKRKQQVVHHKYGMKFLLVADKNFQEGTAHVHYILWESTDVCNIKVWIIRIMWVGRKTSINPDGYCKRIPWLKEAYLNVVWVNKKI